jgi:sigma-B regulation protein RsbU (phosphoserine phosphatase)
MMGVLEQIRLSLQAKQANISNWISSTPAEKRQLALGFQDETAVTEHLQVIETAIQEVETGSLGLCDVCHQQVDSELLQVDYTQCVCLEHLSAQEVRGLESELELASTVQRSLLPQQAPQIPGLEISAFSRPAQIIGGDYFDFLEFQPAVSGLTPIQGVVIADVAGHGISASLHMASIQALLRSIVPTNQQPADVISHLHRLLVHNIHFDNFVTLFLAAFDPDLRSLVYSNAGHNPPLLYCADSNSVAWLWPTGPAIGLVELQDFQQSYAALSPGSVLILYTDGVTEATNPAGEDFGRERLADLLMALHDQPAHTILHAIRDALTEFCGGRQLEDDVTLLAYRLPGS